MHVQHHTGLQGCMHSPRQLLRFNLSIFAFFAVNIKSLTQSGRKFPLQGNFLPPRPADTCGQSVNSGLSRRPCPGSHDLPGAVLPGLWPKCACAPPVPGSALRMLLSVLLPRTRSPGRSTPRTLSPAPGPLRDFVNCTCPSPGREPACPVRFRACSCPDRNSRAHFPGPARDVL